MAQLVLLLSREFVLLVCVANALVWPVAWYAMAQWLFTFSYRIDVGPAFFAMAAGVVVAVTTVSTQAVRAALANPADALRTE